MCASVPIGSGDATHDSCAVTAFREKFIEYYGTPNINWHKSLLIWLKMRQGIELAGGSMCVSHYF